MWLIQSYVKNLFLGSAMNGVKLTLPPTQTYPLSPLSPPQPPPRPSPPGPSQPSSETDTIITVIKGFLSALSAKNPTEFEKYCVRAGGMSLWPPAPTRPCFCTLGAFVEWIAKIEDDIDERIWDPEVKVHELGNLAAVWAPFRAKINGVVDHVGVELFVLHKVDGRWKMTGLADSCRRPTEEEKVWQYDDEMMGDRQAREEVLDDWTGGEEYQQFKV